MKPGSTEPDTRHEPLSMPGFHSGFGDTYYTKVQSRGIEIERDPARQPYDILDFSLLYCNSMRIVFRQYDEQI